MKAIKITYWVSTSIVSLMMLVSSYMYFTNPMIAGTFHHLGFPEYFRIELGSAKLIGLLILIIPTYARLKEWAYAGFTITFISAAIAHTESGDGAQIIATPLILLVILFVSYFTFHKKIAAEKA